MQDVLQSWKFAKRWVSYVEPTTCYNEIPLINSFSLNYSTKLNKTYQTCKYPFQLQSSNNNHSNFNLSIWNCVEFTQSWFPLHHVRLIYMGFILHSVQSICTKPDAKACTWVTAQYRGLHAATLPNIWVSTYLHKYWSISCSAIHSIILHTFNGEYVPFLNYHSTSSSLSWCS